MTLFAYVPPGSTGGPVPGWVLPVLLVGLTVAAACVLYQRRSRRRDDD